MKIDTNLISGAKTLVDRLIHHKVDTVFGYVGGAILPVINALYGQNKIKYISPKTELGGSFMAEGYSRATSKPGVIMVTSGPGAINIMTSLQNAKSDGVQLLALTGQVSTMVLGTDAFQEAPIIDISRPITKWNNMITNPTKINSTIDFAFDKMKEKRFGPVLLDLPKNVMSIDTIQIPSKIELNESVNQSPDSDKKKYSHLYNFKRIIPETIIGFLKKSKRPVILVGQGVFSRGGNTVNLLRAFAKSYNIPVTTTLLGLGAFDEKHDLSLKMLGMHGSYYANNAIQNCDLLINFGSRFDDRIIGDKYKFARKATIIHIDISEDSISKTILPDYYILGDCREVLKRLLSFNKDFNNDHTEWFKQINEWKKIGFSFPYKRGKLQGREVISAVNDYIANNEGNFTIVADVGAHQMWAAQFIDYNYPRVKFITSGGLGSMGYALPASIGYKIGVDDVVSAEKPKETVICICGDGGFTMSLIELLTAVENKVNIKVLVINNSCQLMVKMWQDKFYDKRQIGVKMNNPNFEVVAKSLGCASVRIQFKNQFQREIKYFLDYKDGPIVANVITDDNEPVLPMVSPGKALNEMIIDEDDNEKLEGDAPC